MFEVCEGAFNVEAGVATQDCEMKVFFVHEAHGAYADVVGLLHLGSSEKWAKIYGDVDRTRSRKAVAFSQVTGETYIHYVMLFSAG